MSLIDRTRAALDESIAVYQGIANDPDRVAALDRDLTAVAARFDRGPAAMVMDWEYLIVTARKRN